MAGINSAPPSKPALDSPMGRPSHPPGVPAKLDWQGFGWRPHGANIGSITDAGGSAAYRRSAASVAA